MVLQSLISSHLIQIHFQFSIVIDNRICLALLENATSSANGQFPPLLQKLTYFISTELHSLISCDLLHRFVNLIEIGHFCFDSDLLDCTPVAAPERFDSVQGFDIEVLWDGYFDLIILVILGLPLIQRQSKRVLTSQRWVVVVWPAWITPSLVGSRKSRKQDSWVIQNQTFSSSAKNQLISQQLIIFIIRAMSQEQVMIMSRCPFDSNHNIQAKKLQKHIEKCKSPKRADFQQCKFNPAHWYLTRQAAQHLSKCQNNIYADKSKIGHKLDISSVSEIKPHQSFQEGQSIISLIKLEDRRPNVNKKGNRVQMQEKKIFQQLEEVHKKDNGIWEEPSFKTFCEEYRKRVNKQKSKAPTIHFDLNQSDFF